MRKNLDVFLFDLLPFTWLEYRKSLPVLMPEQAPKAGVIQNTVILCIRGGASSLSEKRFPSRLSPCPLKSTLDQEPQSTAP